MTVEEKVRQLLESSGLTPNEATVAIEAFKESENGKSMRGRWSSPVEDYPPTFFSALLFSVDQVFMEKVLSPDATEEGEEEAGTAIVTCSSCGEELHIPLWQFEVTVEEEGKCAEFYCSLCGPVEVL